MKSLNKIIFFFGIFLLVMLSLRVSAQSDSSGDNRIYMIVPQMPTFPGDLDNFMADHLRYPQSAINRGISGTVNITFVIKKTGAVSDVAVLSGVSADIDSEAVRVVKSMPPWNPGKKDGKAVNVQYNLPVYFALNNPKSSNNAAPPPFQRQEVRPAWDSLYYLRDGLYVDPDLGYGLGGPSSSNLNNTQITSGSSFKFGANVSYMFPSNLGISIGLQVQQYSFNYTYSNIAEPNNYYQDETALRTTSTDTTVTAGYDATLKYTFTYAQIPILCRYISSQENRVGLYAEAGLVANYLVNSQISGSATQTQYLLNQPANTNIFIYESTSTTSQNISTPSQNPAKLTMSAHAAVGVLLPLTAKMSLIISVSSDMGIMNAGDGSKDLASFGSSQFYFYGQGTYGTFNAISGEVKLLIKMSKEEHVAHYR